MIKNKKVPIMCERGEELCEVVGIDPVFVDNFKNGDSNEKKE
jgi:hypothetical protein